MANSAALISHTTSSKASILDVMAERSLRSSVKPAWDFVFNWLLSRYPSALKRCFRWRDELFLGLMCALDQHYLQKHGASFTEAFYGLERSCMALGTSLLARYWKWFSLASLTFLPYLIDKLDRYCKQAMERRLSEERAGMPKDEGPKKTWTRNFYQLYGLACSLMKIVNSLIGLAYVFRRTEHPSLIFLLLKSGLRYKSGDDSVLVDSGPTLNGRAGNTIAARIAGVLRGIPIKAIEMLARLAPAFFFFLQFLEAWSTRDTAEQRAVMSPPIAPPPDMPKLSESADVDLPTSSKLCPLCCSVRKNPTTLPSSGFVFCYSCIHAYLQKHGRCPLTQRPCSLDSMIKLYVCDE